MTALVHLYSFDIMFYNTMLAAAETVHNPRTKNLLAELRDFHTHKTLTAYQHRNLF